MKFFNSKDYYFEKFHLKRINRHRLNYLASLDNFEHKYEKVDFGIWYGPKNEIYTPIREKINKLCYEDQIAFADDINYDANIYAWVRENLDDNIIFGNFTYRGILAPENQERLNFLLLILQDEVKLKYCTKQYADEYITSLKKDISCSG